MRRLKAIDLCCGAGGWSCAARGLPIDIVAAVDRWDVCCLTHAKNHPHTEVICRDVTGPEVEEFCRGLAGSIDLVLSAIPCEWLSIRRNIGNGVTDQERERERKTLDAVLGLVKLIDPRWWCLEDVIQLRGELPPLTPYQVLDASAWSPQRRKRLFVGKFPRPKKPLTSEQVMQEAIRPGPYRLGRRSLGRTPATSNTFTPDKLYCCDPAKKSPTIFAISSQRDTELVVKSPSGFRQLEWQEAARLQGFPEDYLFVGSPTDVWKMISQAIQIDLGRAILEAICAKAQ